MKELCFFGDIHGQYYEYNYFIKNLKSPSIQLGDLGLGFYNKDDSKNFLLSENHKFIRGNHDNPEVCRKNPHYLGDYGITEDGIFFVSGARSIDWHYRTAGYDWWEDEELSVPDFNKVLELYEKEKPEIIISHSQPNEVINTIFGDNYKSKTQDYFSEMYRIHQPKKWISAHLHKDYEFNLNNTTFICVGTLSKYILKEF